LNINRPWRGLGYSYRRCCVYPCRGCCVVQEPLISFQITISFSGFPPPLPSQLREFIMDSKPQASSGGMSSEGIFVAIRMRPLNERELNSGQQPVFRCSTNVGSLSPPPFPFSSLIPPIEQHCVPTET
jgi:hypothetical protein